MNLVGVVGLRYVGLSLSVELSKKYHTTGFDLSPEKVEHYRRGIDPTGEVSSGGTPRRPFAAFHHGYQIAFHCCDNRRASMRYVS